MTGGELTNKEMTIYGNKNVTKLWEYIPILETKNKSFHKDNRIWYGEIKL